jgi:hypothetical protein
MSASIGPGLARARVVDDLDARERELMSQLDATRRAKADAAVSVEDPCATERCMVHAAFRGVVSALDRMGWSRVRIAAHFHVSPTTIHEWFETGDKQRKEPHLRVIARMAELPEPAWAVWQSFVESWRFRAARTGTNG